MAVIFDCFKRTNMLAVIDTETNDVRKSENNGKEPKGFPHPLDCEIVALSMSVAIQDTTLGERALKIISLGTARGTEAEVLQTFVSFLAKNKPLIVGFNSNKFDLEVIKYRCMVNGIAFPVWYQEGSKWESYRARYSIDWHLDLMEFLSTFGASKMFKLDHVARRLGLPGKFGISGKDVGPLYEAGEIETIRDYCETDVAMTYAVLLRTLHLTGDLSTSGFKISARMFLDYLGTLSENKPHISEFVGLIDIDTFLDVKPSIEEQILVPAKAVGAPAHNYRVQ